MAVGRAQGEARRRSRFPHPLVLLVACVLVAAVLTHLLPAGRYERRHDPTTGREVVVAGSYHAVAPAPVGPFAAIIALPQGIAQAADVIALVLLVGGAFAIVERTGALARGVDWLARRLERHRALVIPVASLAFATGGLLEGMQEEIIPLIPILLLLTRRLGYDAVTAVAISVGAAVIGSSFSPINPFNVGIAQRLAGLPVLSAAPYRMIFVVPALAVWIWGTLRWAARTAVAPQTVAETAVTEGVGRAAVVLLAVVASFAIYVFGVIQYDWGFDQLSAIFFVLGVGAGLVAGLGLSGTAEAFTEGLRSMAFAAAMIGFARAIYVVLERGEVVDTIVHGLFAPVSHLPVGVAAIGMMVVHVAVHVPVPSTSGQAVLTLPILTALSDLIGLSRQVTVLAYQYGAGLCDLVTPTNGAVIAILAAARVPYERWIRFVLPLWLAAMAIGLVALGIATAIGLH